MKKVDFVQEFTKTLEDNGDMFFTSGDPNRDYETITGTIKAQGFWAGIRTRYYFDEDYNLLRTEEREFGIQGEK